MRRHKFYKTETKASCTDRILDQYFPFISLLPCICLCFQETNKQTNKWATALGFISSYRRRNVIFSVSCCWLENHGWKHLLYFLLLQFITQSEFNPSSHFSKHLSMHLILGLFLSFSFHRLSRQVRVKTIFEGLDESGRSFFTVVNDKWSKNVNFWLKCVHSAEVNYLVDRFPTRKKKVCCYVSL